MATEIKVPTLGESVTTATVARWLKKAGEAVAADEPLVELETDKVTVEVNAPAAGVMRIDQRGGGRRGRGRAPCSAASPRAPRPRHRGHRAPGSRPSPAAQPARAGSRARRRRAAEGRRRRDTAGRPCVAGGRRHAPFPPPPS